MKAVVLLLVAALATPALAQYKCVINGKTVYADAPCARDAQPVGAMQDSVAQRNEIEALRRSLSDQQKLQRLEQGKSAEQARFDSQAASIAEADRRAAAARATRCASAQGDKTYNDRRVARYQDWGWGNSQQQARAERDAAERRMRDSCD